MAKMKKPSNSIDDDGVWTDEEDDDNAVSPSSGGIARNVLSDSTEEQRSAQKRGPRATGGSSREQIEEMEKTLEMLKAISLRRKVPVASIIKTLKEMNSLHVKLTSEIGAIEPEPRSYLPEFEGKKIHWSNETSIADAAKEYRAGRMAEYRIGPPKGPLPIVYPKTWKPEDFGENPEDWPPERPLFKKEGDHPQCGTFLRGNDLPSQSRERCIMLILLQAHVQFLGDNHDGCIKSAEEALQIAKEHFSNYPPLAARCCVYMFRCFWRKGELDTARKWFNKSRPCVGCYSEGEYVKVWEHVLFPPEGQEAEPAVMTKKGEGREAALAVIAAEELRRERRSKIPRVPARPEARPRHSFDAPDSIFQKSPGGTRPRGPGSFRAGVNLGRDSMSEAIFEFQNDFYQDAPSSQSSQESQPKFLGGLASQRNSVSFSRPHTPPVLANTRRPSTAVDTLTALRNPTTPNGQTGFFGHSESSKQPPPGQPFPFHADKTGSIASPKWNGKSIVGPAANGKPPPPPPPPPPARTGTRNPGASKRFSGPDENRKNLNLALRSSMEALREASAAGQEHQNGTDDDDVMEASGEKGKKPK